MPQVSLFFLSLPFPGHAGQGRGEGRSISTGNDDGKKHNMGGNEGDVNITCSCGFVPCVAPTVIVMRATMAATVRMGEAVGGWVGTYHIIPGYHTIRFKSNLVWSV